MFTGIISEKGQVARIVTNDLGREIHINCRDLLSQIEIGDSVCCNGICLSATTIDEGGFTCYAVQETLDKTNLSRVKEGDEVNLELALTAKSKMGGHYVTGHIDAAVQVIGFESLSDGSAELEVDIPENLIQYFIVKGSVCLNGVSLTVAGISGNHIKVALIPITLQETNLKDLKKETLLNLEVDMMAKYLENFLKPYLERMKV